MQGVTHVIGAGLAGLSTATMLASQGKRVMLYEASGQAGGRCRSYYDAAFGGVIDNGNHLLLSGNHAALAYLKRIGAQEGFAEAGAAFHFIDTRTGGRFTLYPGKGFSFFLGLVKHPGIWRMLLLSALNAHPCEASARLTMSILRRTILKGGRACMPLVAHGLSAIFIDPALHYLEAQGAMIFFHRRLRNIAFSDNRATALEFAGGDKVDLAACDNVICAIPSWSAAPLLPGIDAPDEYRGILNAHFRIAPSPGFPVILGVLNATVEWIFAFPDRISITISDADRLMDMEREELARLLWQETAEATGLASALPPWQIVKEKRATFAATRKQDRKRPGAVTPWRNVYLAGDWVQTGLPATIEGAIFSGQRAAEMSMAT